MLKKLAITSIVAVFALLTPALAQTPDTGSPAAASSDKPAKAAPKKHKQEEAAAKKAKAKSGAGTTDSEKYDGDSKQ